MSGAIDAWASCQSASTGTNAATSAMGTIANVTTGIATALASGPTSETCWNSASDSGTRPSVIAHCARAALATLARPRAMALARAWRAAVIPGVDQQPDREERQPEPRRQHRPRVEREHGDERPQPDDQARARTREPQAECRHREHRERALRRHLRAREQHVAERRAKAEHGRHTTRRNMRREARRAPCQCECRPAREPCEDGDVQPADADQVAGAGAVEDVPLPVVEAGLVADRERDEHGGVRCAGKGSRDAVADALACALHVVERAPGECVDADIGLTDADVARRAHVAFEEPGLEVESPGIDVAVRPPQADRQVPALACTNLGNLDTALGIGPSHLPGERYTLRHLGPCGVDALDGEGEADAVRRASRQVVDHADEPEILAFPRRWQRIGESQLRAPGGVAMAHQHPSSQHRDGAGPRGPGAQQPADDRARTAGHERPPGGIGQFGARLQPRDAEREGGDERQARAASAWREQRRPERGRAWYPR